MFVPISIRFGTNSPDAFYTILATKLASAFGKELNSPGSNVSKSFEEICLDLLDPIAVTQKPLLIAIDGLDEATGWEIHRAVLRPGQGRIRFIVSARAADSAADQWLNRVGWKRDSNAETLELDRLERKGIEQILAKAGLASVADDGDVDIIGELMRLSEGDPLLIEYYVHDFSLQIERTGKIDSAAIVNVTAGFSALTSPEWVQSQKPLWETAGDGLSSLIEAVLALLACAMGPLRHRDLEMLLDAHQMPGGFTATRLRLLARFVLAGPDGYVLAHPRLGEHLRSSEVFDNGRMIERSVNGFLAWGNTLLRGVNSGALAPRDMPPYLLQFFCSAYGALRTPGIGVYIVCERRMDESLGSLRGRIPRLFGRLDARHFGDQTPGRPRRSLAQLGTGS